MCSFPSNASIDDVGYHDVASAGENGEAARSYFTALSQGVMPSVQTDISNLAEWIVEITVQADRDGRAEQLAAAYRGSQLAADNANQLQASASIWYQSCC